MRNEQVVAVVELCRRNRRLERDPETPVDALDAASRETDAAARALWARPVETFDDVVARALVAHDLADKAEDGTLLRSDFAQEQAAIELIEAVLALAERLGLDT